MMFRLLSILALVSSSILGYPEAPEPRCNCEGGSYYGRITCSKVDNESQLRRSINSMRRECGQVGYINVEIRHSNFRYLPSDLFKGFSVRHVRIENTTLYSLSDTDVAFAGLENALLSLQVHDSTVLSGFKWSHLRNLSHLRQLWTIRVATIEVDVKVKNLSMETLGLMKDSISYLHDTAFSALHKLKTLALQDNPIREVKRSMFPDQLETLILSYCKLYHLPADLFVRMPDLRRVELQVNQLTTLGKATFEPVWNQLEWINVGDNPLHCDCRLDWLQSQTRFPWSTSARCAGPARLKDKWLKDLAADDLWC